VERKGFQWFANEVMPTLPDGVIWLLVGEGPETHTIREAVGANGLQSRVRLLGRVPEEHLWNLYLGSDLFIMPNIPVPGDMEGFGVVMLEAGLCGLPVLTSDLEGIRDVISEGSNGRLLPSGDASAFASAIMQYWRDRAKQGGESEDAAVYIRSTFPWSRIAERYGHTLQKLHESSVVA
jgi:phosphatidylinositol alpha-1,6-mannosyltransferase